MRFCELENRTLIAYDSSIEQIMAVKGGRIIGAMGSCIDGTLCHMKKRKCKIVGENYLGTRLDNGTYTGALGLLQSGKGDLYLKGEPDTLINEPFADRSVPINVEDIWGVQILNDDDDFDYFDLLENFIFSWQIYFSFFSALISFALICFALLKFRMRSNENYQNKKIVPKLIYLSNYLTENKQISIKSILLFFGLFLWFNLLFITNTIKTNKVVVDTNVLIKNREEFLKFGLVCFANEDTAYNLAISSPKDIFLSKLYHFKAKLDVNKHKKEIISLKNERCIFQKSATEYNFMMKNKVLVMTEVEASGMFIFIAQLSLAKKIWIVKKEIQEFNAVIFYRPVKGHLKVQLQRMSYGYTEHGITSFMYSCIFGVSEFAYRRAIKIYKSLNEYAGDYDAFSNLELDNFKSLFIIYFSLLCFIFTCFFLLEIVPFYYRKLI